MAADHETSVGTLHKALADFETKGLLARECGSGNYVRHEAEICRVYALSWLEKILGGGLPTAQLLSVDRIAKSDKLPTFGTSSTADRTGRLRMLDGQVATLEETWLDGDCGAAVTFADLSESL